jgi:hypothetical protein
MAQRLCRAILTVALLCRLPPTLAAAGGPVPAPAPDPAPAPAPTPPPAPGALPPVPPAGGRATTATAAASPAAPQCAASYGPCRSTPDTDPPPCHDGAGWRCEVLRRLQSANADSAINIPTKCCEDTDMCAAHSVGAEAAELRVVCVPAEVWLAEAGSEYDDADYAEPPNAKTPPPSKNDTRALSACERPCGCPENGTRALRPAPTVVISIDERVLSVQK